MPLSFAMLDFRQVLCRLFDMTCMRSWELCTPNVRMHVLWNVRLNICAIISFNQFFPDSFSSYSHDRIAWYSISYESQFCIRCISPFSIEIGSTGKSNVPHDLPLRIKHCFFLFLHSPKMLFPLHHLCFPIILSIDWTFSMNSTILYVILVPNFFLLKHKHPKS